jgi:hypothetical protein
VKVRVGLGLWQPLEMTASLRPRLFTSAKKSLNSSLSVSGQNTGFYVQVKTPTDAAPFSRSLTSGP